MITGIDLDALDAHIAKAGSEDEQMPVTARWLRAVRAELAQHRRDAAIGAVCKGIARPIHPPIGPTASGYAW